MQPGAEHELVPSNTSFLPDIDRVTDAPLEPPRLRYWVPGLAVFVVVWVLVVAVFLPDPMASARAHGILALVGFAGAVIGNATAIGGGLVFVPLCMFVFKMSAVESLYLALAAQSLGMTSGALAWIRTTPLPMRALWISLPAMLVGGTVSAVVVQPSPLLVKGIFGPMSILIGLVTLCLVDRHSEHEEIPSTATLPLFAFACLGGLLTGWVAIGVGEVVAAYLMLRCGLRPERSIGLGVVLLAVVSIYLTAIHTAYGNIPWEMAAFMGFGCVFGARLGPFLCQWVSIRWLKIGFATIAIVDGVLFVWQSMR